MSHAVRLRRKGVRRGLRAGARAAHFAAFLARDLRRRTGVRVCRWRRGGGKFWPQLKEVAELVGFEPTVVHVDATNAVVDLTVEQLDDALRPAVTG